MVNDTPQECAGICDDTEGCVAFGYDKRNTERYVCNFKHTCQNSSIVENADTYLKGEFYAERNLYKGFNSNLNVSINDNTFKHVFHLRSRLLEAATKL